MEESQPDLTDNLPLEIVKLILSFLSMKEAVRTCLLSTAWSSLWKPLVVNLESDHGASDQRTELCNTMKQGIAVFLNNQDATRKLKFSIGSKTGAVVTKGYNNEMHIDFHPEIFAGNQSLAEFKLECSACSHRDFPAPEMETACFLSLKTLHLRSITAGLAEDFVSSLLPSCCSLESLKLEKCGGLRRIDIVTTGGGNLQMLDLCDCSDVDSLVISAPNLKTLHYAGVLPTTIQLQGTPPLADVKFDFGHGLCQTEFDCEQLILLLSSLKETESLTINGWIIEWMCSAGVIFGCLDFQLHKLKNLQCTYSSMNPRKRDSLACFLNIAPVLEMLFIINRDQDCRNVEPQEAPLFHEYWHEPHLWKKYTTVKSEASRLGNLKVVMIIGLWPSSNSQSKHEHDHELVLLMDLLLHKASNLNEMRIVTRSAEETDDVRISMAAAGLKDAVQSNMEP